MFRDATGPDDSRPSYRGSRSDGPDQSYRAERAHEVTRLLERFTATHGLTWPTNIYLGSLTDAAVVLTVAADDITTWLLLAESPGWSFDVVDGWVYYTVESAIGPLMIEAPASVDGTTLG